MRGAWARKATRCATPKIWCPRSTKPSLRTPSPWWMWSPIPTSSAPQPGSPSSRITPGRNLPLFSSLFLTLGNLLDVDTAMSRQLTPCVNGCGRVYRGHVQALPALYDDEALDIRRWKSALEHLPLDIHAVYGQRLIWPQHIWTFADPVEHLTSLLLLRGKRERELLAELDLGVVRVVDVYRRRVGSSHEPPVPRISVEATDQLGCILEHGFSSCLSTGLTGIYYSLSCTSSSLEQRRTRYRMGMNSE